MSIRQRKITIFQEMKKLKRKYEKLSKPRRKIYEKLDKKEFSYLCDEVVEQIEKQVPIYTNTFGAQAQAVAGYAIHRIYLMFLDDVQEQKKFAEKVGVWLAHNHFNETNQNKLAGEIGKKLRNWASTVEDGPLSFRTSIDFGPTY